MSETKVLFVDDDKDILSMVEQYLSMQGYNVTTVDNGIEAVGIVKEKGIDIVFTDYKMPEFNGLELLAAIKKYRPDTEVIIVTGYGSMESAIQAMKFGSYDYLQKPFKLDHLKLIIDRIVEEKKIKDKARLIRKSARDRLYYEDLIGFCPKMLEIYEVIDTISVENPMVLIQGESGTGKQLTAKTIHLKSDRKDKSFVPLNCGSISGKVKENDMGDYIKGFVETADGGTIYLDEISQLKSNVRKKLLGAVNEREEKIGEKARLIAGTSAELDDVIASGAMKQDLLDLFNAVFVKLPPLRERKEDICLLINHFLFRAHGNVKNKIYGIAPDALDILLKYHWPGNIIQLQNVIERAYALGIENVIRVDDLPAEIKTFGEISKMS